MSILNCSDDDLVEKLRIENIRQFETLVRMHLSFLLDINTYDSTDTISSLKEKSAKKRKLVLQFNSKKTKCAFGIMDGVPLTQEGICQVYQLVEFLKKDENIRVEGIFRRTGSLTRQQELKNLLNSGRPLGLEDNIYNVHDCASVLKSFLAELPEPLLTNAHYFAHCQIADICCNLQQTPEDKNQSKLLLMIQLLLFLLPPQNRILLRDILDLLQLTASHCTDNKMCADNLATVFTPHLICPRQLSPHSLHDNLNKLCKVISFMIRKSKEIFKVPANLAVDVRAYFSEREKRKQLCPNKKHFDESISDNVAANTVYSFVDVARTAKENESNPTETALAELYAHIQSLPESSKKRKLVKQFNKENGHGTPLQLLQNEDNRGFSSIKKYVFENNLKRGSKKVVLQSFQTTAGNEEQKSPFQGLAVKAKLFCTNCDTNSDVSIDESSNKRLKISSENTKPSARKIQRSNSDPNLSLDRVSLPNSHLTSTPAYALRCDCNESTVVTPLQDKERSSMSPITRSTQRMSKAMQESMMTPRSRKPVLLVSGTNIRALPTLQKDFAVDSIEEEKTSDSFSNLNVRRKSKSLENLQENEDPLSNTFREYLRSRSMLTATPTDLSFTSGPDDYCSPHYASSSMSSSLLHCLNGYTPPEVKSSNESLNNGEKELVLRPKQFDDNGMPTMYETSF